jgi:hypothetical protein
VFNTVDDYSRTFETEWGQRVLANMMTEAGMFKLNHTPEDQAVENFMKTILAKTGRYPVEGVSTENRIHTYVMGITRMKRNLTKRIFKMKKEY